MTRPHRLLMTVDAVGGVWQYATGLAAALAPLGYDTVLALLGPPPSDAQRRALAAIPSARLIETGLPLDWLAADATAVEAAGAMIARLSHDLAADAVQLNQPALAAARRPQAPTVAVVHSCVATWWQAVNGGQPPADFAWQTSLVSRGLAAVDAVVCPSAAMSESLRLAYGLKQPPRTVHNGRTPLAAPPAALHDFAFTAGRLWDQGKNVATLDRAAARLGVPFKAAGPLVGPHGETTPFDHLHTLGSVDERVIARCLAARPVFASAAYYEPFGLAVLEAALAGCPLVLSDIPTFRELWDGAASFVAPDDAEGFADTIEAMLGDTSMRLAHGDLARQRAARFTPRRMAIEMAGVYRGVGVGSTAGQSVAA